MEKKKPRIRAAADGDAFDTIISMMKDQQAGRRQNKVELAIQLLQEQYQERLSTSDFIDAVGILENSAKASIFITLKSSKIRDLWLQKHACIYLSNEGEDREFV